MEVNGNPNCLVTEQRQNKYRTWVNNDRIKTFWVDYPFNRSCLDCHIFALLQAPGHFVFLLLKSTQRIIVFWCVCVLQERWTLQWALRRCKPENCVAMKWWLFRTKAELILWCREFWWRYVPLLYVSAIKNRLTEIMWLNLQQQANKSTWNEHYIITFLTQIHLSYCVYYSKAYF